MAPQIADTVDQRLQTLMRAAVIQQPRCVEVVRQSLPAIGPKQVRVRLEGCGVCASNGPVWEGRPWFDYPRPPGSPGHEGWGVVDECGEEVDSLKRGDRVALLSYHAFAEYDIADATRCVSLPQVLLSGPAPGEPLACAVNVFRRSDIQPNEKVVIVGIGFLGALLVQLVTSAGAEVIAISRRDFALQIAEQCGAKHLLRFDDPRKVGAQLRQFIEGDGCSRVIEAVGSQVALNIASELVATRGKLIIAGFHQDGTRQVNMQSWNWRGLDVVNAHERDFDVYIQGMREAFDLVATKKLDLEPLMTHQFSLDELAEALDMNLERPNGFLKAWIDCNA